MKHLFASLLATLALACDAAVVADAKNSPVAAEAVVSAPPATIEAEALDLESINYLVKKGKVKEAAELEKKLNNPKEKLNSVDIDGDGKIDRIQIVEVQKENDVKVFELHVIPSKSKSKGDEVVIAYITFEPDKANKKLLVKSVFAPIVIGHETIVYDYDVAIEVIGDKIVVAGGIPFYAWLFTVSRPVFIGVYVFEAPPPPVIVIERRKHWNHRGHGWKGKGWKGKG